LIGLWVTSVALLPITYTAFIDLAFFPPPIMLLSLFGGDICMAFPSFPYSSFFFLLPFFFSTLHGADYHFFGGNIPTLHPPLFFPACAHERGFYPPHPEHQSPLFNSRGSWTQACACRFFLSRVMRPAWHTSYRFFHNSVEYAQCPESLSSLHSVSKWSSKLALFPSTFPLFFGSRLFSGPLPWLPLFRRLRKQTSPAGVH